MTDEPIESLLARLEALHAKATPGPWKDYGALYWFLRYARKHEIYEVDDDNENIPNRDEDSTYLVALHNAFPRLLRELRAAEKMHCGHPKQFDDSDGGCEVCSLKRCVDYCDEHCPDETREEVEAMRTENARLLQENACLLRENLDRKLPTRDELAEWRKKYGRYLDSKFRGMMDKLLFAAEERERLERENTQYRENLGDIVTFGTTAESLDAKLREVLSERDTLQAENACLRSQLAAVQDLERLNEGGYERTIEKLQAVRDAAQAFRKVYDEPARLGILDEQTERFEAAEHALDAALEAAKLDEARCFAEDAARRYNEILAETRVLRCAFCDAEYPDGTPPTQHEALTRHVMECPAHPLRAEIERLRAENARLLQENTQYRENLLFAAEERERLETMVPAPSPPHEDRGAVE